MVHVVVGSVGVVAGEGDGGGDDDDDGGGGDDGDDDGDYNNRCFTWLTRGRR